MSVRKPVSIEEWLYRRGFTTPKYTNLDGSPTSRAFKPRDLDNGELSVNVKSMTTIELSIQDPKKFCLFELSNAAVEAIANIKTYHDPLPDGTNNAHAVIVMAADDDISPGLLARKSQRVIL